MFSAATEPFDTVHARRVTERNRFTGKTCGVPTEASSRCPEGPCANGGSCVPRGGAWRCACAPGWAGAACAQPAQPPPAACACAHGGSCAPAPPPAAGWACACAPGWAGPRCERALDACAARPCRNGGRCRAAGGRRACDCPPGWAGDDCGARAAPACGDCPAPAACEPDPDPERPARCVCPRDATRCLEREYAPRRRTPTRTYESAAPILTCRLSHVRRARRPGGGGRAGVGPGRAGAGGPRGADGGRRARGRVRRGGRLVVVGLQRLLVRGRGRRGLHAPVVRAARLPGAGRRALPRRRGTAPPRPTPWRPATRPPRRSMRSLRALH